MYACMCVLCTRCVVCICICMYVGMCVRMYVYILGEADTQGKTLWNFLWSCQCGHSFL